MKSYKWHDRIAFGCPGCQCKHFVPIEGAKAWGFNNDFEKPTLTPSVLNRTGPYGPMAAEHGKTEGQVDVCHFFLTDGAIHYCGDCTHAMAGQLVELPDIEEGISYPSTH